MKKFLSAILCACMILGITACGRTTPGNAGNSVGGNGGTSSEVSSGTNFPTATLNGTIVWAAGGACDNTSRAISPLAAKELGQNIIMTNREGASNAIAVKYVYDQAADGYNILFGAESIQMGKVLGTTELDYDNFIPINIFCQGVGVVLVRPGTYETITDLVQAMLDKPGEIRSAITGPSGTSIIVDAMFTDLLETKPNEITFDGEGPAVTALLGGHVDFTAVTMSAASEMIKSGDLVPLALIHNEPLAGFEDIPLVTSAYPEFEKFLPWGPFFGAWVKESTPDDVVEVLRDAFAKAVETDEFQDFLKNAGNLYLGITGDEADSFTSNFKSVSSWLLYDIGTAEISPEEFGIPRT